jgi:DNA repair protein RecO (recombination protein O)
MSQGVELRAGAPVEMHALVLGTTPYQDSDKLVRLLTLEAGRITAFAPSAQKSVKRFGGSLEPLTYVKAHLKAPRESQGGENSLWRLQSVDLRGQFEHWRQNYAAIDTSMFILKMILDFVPESHSDPLLFKTLGKFLRDSSQFNFNSSAPWMRAYFWSWFTRHLGYGDLCEPWESEALDLPEDFWKLWWVSIEPGEPLVTEFLDFLAHQKLPPRSSGHETRLYEHWLALTSLHWDYFQKWLSSKP